MPDKRKNNFPSSQKENESLVEEQGKYINSIKTKKGSFLALTPLIFFITLYLGISLLLSFKNIEMAFYQFPAPIAMTCAVIFAMIIFKGPLEEKINTFLEGIGQQEILYMCLIYLLSGAFATISSSMGAVEATANLGISLFSPAWLIAGFFILASFIGTATGTSVGTIATMTPIAIVLAEKASLPLPYVLSATLGGAMLGDNLSLISDTSIASSRTQGASLPKVVMESFKYALPAALLSILVFWYVGKGISPIPLEKETLEPIKIIPYLVVFSLAIGGVNVLFALVLGIISAIIIGLFLGSFPLLNVGNLLWDGFNSMNDIFILSFLTGGLSFMVLKEGGIAWLLEKIQSLIKGVKTASLSVSLLSFLSDLALANNTIAILLSGGVTKEIAKKYHIKKERAASLIDSFSCLGQSFIPYGAQLLILTGFTQGAVSPIEMIPFLFYPMFQGFFLILSLFGLDIGIWQNLFKRKKRFAK